jgi:DNA-binding NarL/FixJ family response regulator
MLARPETPPIRVLVADDHPVVRAGLRFTLTPALGFEICGEAENADDALALGATHRPRLVILDLNLNGRDGDRTITLMRRACPEAAILVFSMNPEELFAERALGEGASGYLMKTDGFEALHEAVRQVLAGEVFLSVRMRERSAATAVSSGAGGGTGFTPKSVASLTARELQILHRIGAGRGSAEIAEELGLSIKTISAHRENLKKKLGAPTAAELIRQAVAWVLERDRRGPQASTQAPE